MATKPQYEVIVLKNVMVPMRDGVHLAADVYVPSRGGRPAPPRQLADTPLPALLERTPYCKDNPQRAELHRLLYAQRGYVVLLPDVPGRSRSEGPVHLLVQEA